MKTTLPSRHLEEMLVLGRRQLEVRVSENRTRWRENLQQDRENLCP